MSVWCHTFICYFCSHFQCYSLAVVGYRVATFNDCVEASEELKQVNPNVCAFKWVCKWSGAIVHLLCKRPRFKSHQGQRLALSHEVSGKLLGTGDSGVLWMWWKTKVQCVYTFRASNSLQSLCIIHKIVETCRNQHAQSILSNPRQKYSALSFGWINKRRMYRWTMVVSVFSVKNYYRVASSGVSI
jgi:hypothetical protein